MNKLNQKLSEVLDVEPIQFETLPTVIKTPVEDDAEFARQNIRELITKGNVAMDNLLHVAKESEHPRAYEVAAGLIKNLSDLNKDLLEVQKRKRDLTGESQSAKNINVDKAVFVGSTTELVKFLKNKDNNGTIN
jgi:hypothetical protein